jgi:uncharacterized membrane protein
MNLNNRTVGYFVIGFAVLLIVVLAAIKSGMDKRDVTLCADTQKLNLDMASCPVHTTNTGWYIMGAFGISFFILAVGIYLVFMPQHALEKSMQPVDLSKLEEDEKKVYEMLKAANGSMFQGEVIKQLGYTKVTVSRLIDKMEQKGVVERKRRGMANLVVLK